MIRRRTMAVGVAVLWLAVSSGSVMGHEAVTGATEDVGRIRLTLENVAEGLDRSLFVTDSGDDSGDLFILEKPGRILRLPADGSGTTQVFLDITDRVVSSGHAQGLLGLAFHPDYAADPRFFVDYTSNPDGATVIGEFRVVDGQALAASERVVLTVPQPHESHNAGMIAFDAAGQLVISFGDGGSSSVHRPNAQSLDTPLGKIVRMDVDAQTEPEILAMGLRNPWRFSIDSASGDIYIGDVGLWDWEEIDVLPAGAGILNFGWSQLEGPACGPGSICDPAAHTAPVIAYAHDPAGSVIGGYVYRGQSEPLLDGLYIFGDNSQGRIFAAPLKDMLGGAATRTQIADVGSGGVWSLGEDQEGELYVVGPTSVARIHAEEIPAVAMNSGSSEQLYPVVEPQPHHLSDLTIRAAANAVPPLGAPELRSSSQLSASVDANGCLSLDPTGDAPQLIAAMDGGTGWRIDSASGATAQLFLGLEGQYTAAESTVLDLEDTIYEVSLAEASRKPAVLRFHPPSTGLTTLCLITLQT